MIIRSIYRFNQYSIRFYASKAENLTVRAGMHENPGKVRTLRSLYFIVTGFIRRKSKNLYIW